MKKRLNIDVAFLWFDFWVGLYFDRAKKVLYICLLPMLVFSFRIDEIKLCEVGICDAELRKVAYDTGDGWALHYQCTFSHFMLTAKEEDRLIIEWPFENKDYATAKDLMDIGFEII